MARQTESWGVVGLRNNVPTLDGTFAWAIYGFLKIVTDKEWGDKFRSSEKWQLLVFASEDTSRVPAFIIPGCNVKGTCLGKMTQSRNEIYDARNLA